MKKKVSAYLSGVFATVLVLTMVTTALAASGKVSFNFVNVSLRGEQKIAAGADITVANGQNVPSSILYTDEKGGKTNYLPIRAISELLGVEINYDSATKTVQLEKQSTTVDAGTLGQWKRSFEVNMVGYSMSGCSTTQYAESPMWRPTWLPDGWKLTGFSVESPSNALIDVFYQPDTDKVNDRLDFECFAPSNRTCSDFLGTDVDASSMLQKATVNGATADFFKTNDFNLLVWTDTEGNLFKLRGDLDQASLEQIANSVKEVGKDMLPEYDMTWTPVGSSNTSRTSVSGFVKETWKDANDVSFEWLYSRSDLACPMRTPESVTVNGTKAKYWEGNPDGGFDLNWRDEPFHVYTQEQKNVLVWTDSKVNITFRIIGMMDKDEMIKMAESVVVK